MEAKSIKVSDLQLWDENARVPDKYFNKSEKEIISHFLSKKEFKIEILAKEIVKDFDLLQLENIIVYNNWEANIVLEWNRRLIVYKLLINPSLAYEKHIKEKFEGWKKIINIGDDFSLNCIVSSNEADCYRYIERKHLNWNNEVDWWEQERTHHKVRSGNANEKEKFKAEIARIIKNLDIPEIYKEQILGKWYVTNFWRILDSKAAWKEFWFDLTNEWNLKIDDLNFTTKLKVIILNILEKKDSSGKKIDSRTLNTNDQKTDYLKNITNKDTSDVDDKIKRTITSDIFWEQKINIGSKSKKINPKSTTRSYLIPKWCYLDIKEKKINNIYRELRDNLLIDDSNNAVPNAVAVLFRVFLEISLDYFWEKKSWQTFLRDTKLDGKITKISEFMENNSLAKKHQLTNIRSVATSKDSILAIENFHSYVHSYKTQPSSSDLKLKWDNLQEFFEILREIL